MPVDLKVQQIQRDVSLQAFNTLAIPARADHFVEVNDLENLQAAIQWAKDNTQNVLVLGGGSNLILPDAVKGLVVRNNIQTVDFIEQGNDVYVTAGAGVVWHQLVQQCLQRNYFGLENLSLIPGTVGAAPMQNIGAYGVELDSVFHELVALDRNTLDEVRFNREQCEFAYRHSVFKGKFRNRFVIVSVTLKLSKTPTFNLSYPALAEAAKDIAEDALTPIKVSELVCRIRSQKLPDPARIPNVGSFFKNPIIAIEQYNQLLKQFPHIAAYPVDAGHKKIAAGWLVDQAGWRGHVEDGVGVHQHQALVIVNPGKCSAARVLSLAEKIQNDVEQKYQIRLEIEPDIIESV